MGMANGCQKMSLRREARCWSMIPKPSRAKNRWTYHNATTLIPAYSTPCVSCMPLHLRDTFHAVPGATATCIPESRSGRNPFEVSFEKQVCGSSKLPLEHIAAPFCQSLQGINGHMLNVEEMKGCRNHRYLLAKPANWQADESDSILEYSSSFVMSGESSRSYVSPVAPYVYPPRYGVDLVNCWNLYVNSGCNVCDPRSRTTCFLQVLTLI